MKISGYFKLPDDEKALSGRNSIYLEKLIEFSKSVSINLGRIIAFFSMIWEFGQEIESVY